MSFIFLQHDDDFGAGSDDEDDKTK